MEDTRKFYIGQAVTYNPGHTPPEPGMIKSLSSDPDAYFVVYHCNDDWEDYQNYTGALTNKRDLIIGW